MPQFNYNLSVENKLFNNMGLDFLFVQDDERRNELKKTVQKTAPRPFKSLQKTEALYGAQNANALQTANKTQTSDENLIIFDTKAPIKEAVQAIRSSARSSQEAKEMEESAVKNPLYANTLPEFEWPDEWKKLYAACYRPQSKIAWTYTGFHADLSKGEKLDAKRQDLIRRVLPKLDRPNGTHIFVPYDCMDEPGKLLMHNDYSFYWSAIKQLKIRYLLIFGSLARDVLALPHKNKYSSFIFHGLRVNVLPDINNIQEDEEHSLYTFLDGQLDSVGIYRKAN